MQRPAIRFTIITAVLGFIIFGVLFLGAQASEHVPLWISGPLLFAIVIIWAFSEFTDG